MEKLLFVPLLLIIKPLIGMVVMMFCGVIATLMEWITENEKKWNGSWGKTRMLSFQWYAFGAVPLLLFYLAAR